GVGRGLRARSGVGVRRARSVLLLLLILLLVVFLILILLIILLFLGCGFAALRNALLRQPGVIPRIDCVHVAGCVGKSLDVFGPRLGFLDSLVGGGVDLGLGIGVNLGDDHGVEDAGRDQTFLEQLDAIGLAAARRAA